MGGSNFHFPEWFGLDSFIVCLYLVGVLWVGWRSGAQEKDTRDYIVGGRSIPWWAALGSIVATEVSAMTFLNVPGVAFSGNLSYLQTTMGSLLARFFVAGVFIGAFYAANVMSIYEYLAKRFGGRTQLTASCFFIVTRLLGSAIRLLVAATALSVILEIDFLLTLVGFTFFAWLYAGRGGIRAVIYTDCVQALVFIAGGLGVFIYLIHGLGWNPFVETASAAGKLELFRFTPQQPEGGLGAWMNDAELFYVALLFGFLSTTAAMGTDQDMTQRMLTCKRSGEAKLSLILSGFLGLAIAALFLGVGSALFVFYQVNPDAAIPLNAAGQPDPNSLFPHFIATAAPAGLKGLLIAGVLAASMSSIDSAMAALSSSAVVDLVRPLSGNRFGEAQLLRYSRGFMAGFGVILLLIAWSLKDVEQSFLWLSFKLVGIPYSALLGVFLLGLLTQKGSDKVNLAAMISGGIGVGAALYAVEHGHLALAWPWCLFAGTLWTFGVGFLASPKERAPVRT